MGIFDKLKGKKAEDPKPADRASDAAPVSAPKKSDQKSESVSHTSDVLVKPLLSEKGTHFASTGRYVFIVTRHANKPEIKKSIQRVYNVHVEGVRIVNLPSKKRRYGHTAGETSEHKKAIITLKKGEKIPGIIESVG